MLKYIEIRLLVAIVTLSEELNFTRAAKRLGITQSGLSRRVGSLEKKHRIKLFERDHANVVLTEAGRVFVEEAKLSLMHDERAIEVAKAVSEGVESVLTIGRSPYADPFLTSALLSSIFRSIRTCMCSFIAISHRNSSTISPSQSWTLL